MRSLNDTKLANIKAELKSSDWNGLLRSDNCNENFDTFCSVLNDCMDKFAPKQEIRISWKWKYTEPWMTKGIGKASNKCKRLYRTSISAHATEEDVIKYKEYRNTYNQLKQSTMMTYYRLQNVRNMKKLKKTLASHQQYSSQKKCILVG